MFICVYICINKYIILIWEIKYFKKHPCGVLAAVFYMGGAAQPCCWVFSQLHLDRLKSSASDGPCESHSCGLVTVHCCLLSKGNSGRFLRILPGWLVSFIFLQTYTYKRTNASLKVSCNIWSFWLHFQQWWMSIWMAVTLLFSCNSWMVSQII